MLLLVIQPASANDALIATIVISPSPWLCIKLVLAFFSNTPPFIGADVQRGCLECQQTSNLAHSWHVVERLKLHFMRVATFPWCWLCCGLCSRGLGLNTGKYASICTGKNGNSLSNICSNYCHVQIGESYDSQTTQTWIIAANTQNHGQIANHKNMFVMTSATMIPTVYTPLWKVHLIWLITRVYIWLFPPIHSRNDDEHIFMPGVIIS